MLEDEFTFLALFNVYLSGKLVKALNTIKINSVCPTYIRQDCLTAAFAVVTSVIRLSQMVKTQGAC